MLLTYLLHNKTKKDQNLIISVEAALTGSAAKPQTPGFNTAPPVAADVKRRRPSLSGVSGFPHLPGPADQHQRCGQAQHHAAVHTQFRQRRRRCRGGLLTLQRQSRTDTRDGSQPAEQLGDDVAAEVVRWTLCGCEERQGDRGLRWAPLRRPNGLSTTRLPVPAKSSPVSSNRGDVLGGLTGDKAGWAEVQEYRGPASGQQSRGAD